MKPLLSVYLVLCIVITPVIAHAEPPACSEPQAVTTPCSGVLLPTSAATEGLRCLKIGLPKLKLELDYQIKLWESREKRYKSLLEIEQKRGDQLFTQLQEVTVIQKTAWYESGGFYFALGFTIAALTTIGITYAVHQDK
jgi:hypothetical protein